MRRRPCAALFVVALGVASLGTSAIGSCAPVSADQAYRSATVADPDERTQQESPDVSGLFAAYRRSIITGASAAMRDPPEYPIRLYATDDSNTKLCFVSDNRIFIYSDRRITMPLYAKVFNIKAVNRITYRKSGVGGSFLIWIDDELVLSIST